MSHGGKMPNKIQVGCSRRQTNHKLLFKNRSENLMEEFSRSLNQIMKHMTPIMMNADSQTPSRCLPALTRFLTSTKYSLGWQQVKVVEYHQWCFQGYNFSKAEMYHITIRCEDSHEWFLDDLVKLASVFAWPLARHFKRKEISWTQVYFSPLERLFSCTHTPH